MNTHIRGGRWGVNSVTRLWSSVIFHAVNDLFSATDYQGARHEALSFLTDASGGWAESRNNACLLAGLDGDQLREYTIEILEGQRTLYTGAEQSAVRDPQHGQRLWNKKKELRRLAAIQRDGKSKGPRIVPKRIARIEGTSVLIETPWEGQSFCATLNSEFPKPLTSHGRAIWRACQPQGGMVNDYTPHTMQAFENWVSRTRCVVEYHDVFGNVVPSRFHDAYSFRLRHLGPDA